MAEEVADFKALPGNGLTASLKNAVLYGGNYKFVSERASISAEMKARSEQLSEEGKTPLFLPVTEYSAALLRWRT